MSDTADETINTLVSLRSKVGLSMKNLIDEIDIAIVEAKFLNGKFLTTNEKEIVDRYRMSPVHQDKG